MEHFYSKILGTFVMEDDELRPLTTVKDVVMDTEKGQAVGFLVDLSQNLVITPMDIFEWGDNMKVRNENCIIPAEDVIRIVEVMNRGIELFKNKVFTKDGVYLGRVVDFSIEAEGLQLQKILVAKDILGMFRYEYRLISANKIIEIKRNKVVVEKDLEEVVDFVPTKEADFAV